MSVLLATLLAAVTIAPLHAEAAISAEQQLADRYAPVVMVRVQSNVCSTSQEQFAPPTSVGAVLGDPSVRLSRSDGRHMVLVKRAPAAADLAGRGPNYYLDLPGNPLDPQCTYAKAFRALRRAGRAPPVTYVHIAREPGESGFALQYWFYYYFNQFNDLHESDWEGIQLIFDAGTPAQALSEQPSRIVLFQHAGGEHADWTDGRVQKQGTHPVVYAAAGSHATYYESQLYLGNGSHGSGVGCDNTTKPLTAVRPQPVMLPDSGAARGRFAWLSYTGHWGQREASFNNGPTGPNTKDVWSAPLSWTDGTRTASPVVPVGVLGPSVAHRFCSAVAGATALMNLAARTALGAVIAVLLIALIFLTPAFITTWRPVEPAPLGQQRALGQVMLVAARLQWRRRGTLAMLALTSVLLIAALDGLEYLVLRVVGAGETGLNFTDSGNALGAATSAGILQPLVIALTSATTIAALSGSDGPERVSFMQAWGAVLRRLGRIIAAQVFISVALLALVVTIVGIPYAIKKFADWMFYQQELILEDRSVKEAFHASRSVVRGHWVRAIVYAVVFFVIGQILAPWLSYVFLFTSIPALAVNIFGAVLYALLVQYAAIGRTLVYLDLKTRPAPAKMTRARTVAEAPAT